MKETHALLMYFIHLSAFSAFSCLGQHRGNHKTVMYPSCSAVGSLRLLTYRRMQNSDA